MRAHPSQSIRTPTPAASPLRALSIGFIACIGISLMGCKSFVPVRIHAVEAGTGEPIPNVELGIAHHVYEGLPGSWNRSASTDDTGWATLEVARGDQAHFHLIRRPGQLFLVSNEVTLARVLGAPPRIEYGISTYLRWTGGNEFELTLPPRGVPEVLLVLPDGYTGPLIIRWGFPGGQTTQMSELKNVLNVPNTRVVDVESIDPTPRDFRLCAQYQSGATLATDDWKTPVAEEVVAIRYVAGHASATDPPIDVLVIGEKQDETAARAEIDGFRSAQGAGYALNPVSGRMAIERFVQKVLAADQPR